MFRFFTLVLMGLIAMGCTNDTSPADTPVTEETEAEIMSEEMTGGMMGGMMLVNPMQKRESLADINAAVGCTISEPAGYVPENVSYYVFNISPLLGQYKFTVDGIGFTLRASATADDISGVWHGGKTLGSLADENGTDTLLLDDAVWVRWFVGEMQYSLYAESTDADAVYAVRDAMLSQE